MKKLFTLVSCALLSMGAYAQSTTGTESYTAASADGLSSEFKAVIDENNVATNAADGKSIVTFGTDHMTVTAIGGTTPANKDTGEGDDINADGTVNSWKEIKWELKNQGDINFYYLAGTGNPYVKLNVEEIMTEGESTGNYRASYDFYQADGSAGMPVTGLYYKFAPTADGTVKVGVWANKGYRKTFIVEESSMKAMEEGTYTVEGYINGQNDENGKKYLSSEQIDSIHNQAMNAEITKVDTTSTYTDNEKASLISDIKAKYAYTIGAGNQAAWVWISFPVVANKTYWLFQHSSQVGFQGYEFNYTSSGINEVTVDEEKDAPSYNLAGQRVNKDYRGVVIRNGKKYMNR